MRKGSFVFISILFVIAITLAGIYFWNKQDNTTSSDLVLTSLIKGCAETDKGMTRKSGKDVEKEPNIEVNGNEILYSRAINHLCCRKVEIQKETIESTINIFEEWSGIGCRCICFSEIEATVSNIPTGLYIVNVYEKGTEPDGSNEPMEQKLIISKEIVIQ